jgi:acyl carrier protein
MSTSNAGKAELDDEVRDTLGIVLGRTFAPDDPVAREAQPDWDSLKHIELVFALEDVLGVRFDAGEIGELTDVAAIVAIVETHRAP